MRNPLPVLAAALLAAVGAFADTPLPTWKAAEEPWGSWRIVNFSDAQGQGHSLWCKWTECGNVHSGTAALYVVERQSTESYTYHSGIWDFSGSKSSKTTYSTQLSHYILDLKSQSAMLAGSPQLFQTYGQDSLTPLGYLIRVMPPLTMANDLPAAKPTTPATKPSTQPTTKPNTPAHKDPTTGNKPPVKKPTAEVGVPLGPMEKLWLSVSETSIYNTATDAAKKPAAADLVQAYKNGRIAVAKNLRDAAGADANAIRAGYQTLVVGGKFGEIPAYLGKVSTYSGDEIALRDDERTALAAVVMDPSNAMAAYDSEMKKVVDPATGQPKLGGGKVSAYWIVKNYRGMVPKPTDKPKDKPNTKPGTGNDGKTPVMLTKDDFAKVPADKRAALEAEYNNKWKDAPDDKARAALNEEYLKKIADLAATNPTGKKPNSSYDPSLIKTLNDLKTLSPTDQKQFCGMLNSDAGAASGCGDILANADAAVLKCNALKGSDQDATLKARSACMDKVNACKPQAGGKPLTIDSSKLPKDLRDYCATLLATAPTDNTTIGTGGAGKSSAIDSSPCGAGSKKGAKSDAKPADAKPGDVAAGDGTKAGDDVDPCPKKKPEEKKDDPNFYTNLGNGVAFGIAGMLLMSFFGGPLLMLAIGLAVGTGAYEVSKSITSPPDDKDKK